MAAGDGYGRLAGLSMASLCLALLAVGAGPVLAEDWLGDPHLSVIARSADEAARISSVTAPTTDFSAPEPFEANPGGAATVRVTGTADAFSQFGQSRLRG